MKIEICFENCDIVDIPGEHIQYFLVDDVRRSIVKSRFNTETKDIITCAGFYLDLKPSAGKCVTREDGAGCFERLKKWADITSVTIVRDDKSSELIYVPWNQVNDMENLWQQVIEKDGGIIVRVYEQKTDR